jgi:hypothetical protein
MKIYKLSTKFPLEKHSGKNKYAIISFSPMQNPFHLTVEKPPYGENFREIGYFFEILKKYTYLGVGP